MPYAKKSLANPIDAPAPQPITVDTDQDQPAPSTVADKQRKQAMWQVAHTPEISMQLMRAGVRHRHVFLGSLPAGDSNANE